MDMSLPKVTIQIVTWNSLKYLPFTLKSIFSQTYRDFQVLVIDNNSQDGTIDFLRQDYPEVAVFQNKKNLGFARANNQGIRLLHSPYILFCNPRENLFYLFQKPIGWRKLCQKPKTRQTPKWAVMGVNY